ncbi:Lrp/AsnC family transcriptional regulator [Paenibacillus sp. TRM 82003]|uniref:Lrp/AsnC family transcriptional regulator n=1 Tax=Kineococcus sp. TRM81007 TaxID=2925831 RepID=UPI001F5AE887|nr:Lrp/AsnC family transcriptional regulator [Kineococcus sp. TRM81007]MCI2237238.1 Lrp/AsnC family transcriptional regulator [Kineococcus sp. TRM81007]MCI3919420.1 Lrp/AsnC family transcriptional regulator [Paenibacillus sp. TRM 82003]
MRHLDDTDWAIIDALSRDGRLSNVDLADHVGLTPAPCLRRVRRLEGEGVIAGYRAVIDPLALGRSLEVTASVEVSSTHAETVVDFEEAIVAFDEVVEARKVFGSPDYFVRIVVADVAAYERFLMEKLTRLPAVSRVNSHQTMKLLKGQV